MSYPTFSGEVREAFGTKAANRFRAEGKVPLSIATSGGDSIHLLVGSKDADAIWSLFGRVVVIDVAGQQHQVLVNGGSKHPVEDHIEHIDTLAVTDDKVVKVAVPVTPLTADSPGIKAGGLLEQMVRRVTIKVPAKDIPKSLTISLAGINLSQTVYAGSVELPEGAVLITKPRTAVATVVKTRGMRRAEALATQTPGA